MQRFYIIDILYHSCFTMMFQCAWGNSLLNVNANKLPFKCFNCHHHYYSNWLHSIACNFWTLQKHVSWLLVILSDVLQDWIGFVQWRTVGFLAPGARNRFSAPFSDFFRENFQNGNGWPKTNSSHFQKWKAKKNFFSK